MAAIVSFSPPSSIHHQFSAGSALDILHQLADWQMRRHRGHDMNMFKPYMPLDYFHALFLADLLDYISCPITRLAG